MAGIWETLMTKLLLRSDSESNLNALESHPVIGLRDIETSLVTSWILFSSRVKAKRSQAMNGQGRIKKKQQINLVQKITFFFFFLFDFLNVPCLYIVHNKFWCLHWSAVLFAPDLIWKIFTSPSGNMMDLLVLNFQIIWPVQNLVYVDAANLYIISPAIAQSRIYCK